MSGFAVVALVLFGQVVLGVIAAVVGAKALASRSARRDDPGGGPRREPDPVPPYPSGEAADRELCGAGR